MKLLIGIEIVMVLSVICAVAFTILTDDPMSKMAFFTWAMASISGFFTVDGIRLTNKAIKIRKRLDAISAKTPQ